MRKKLRVFSSLAVVVLSVCMFAFGVYAANQVSITTTGTVSFTATGVFAEVTGQISGVSETVTYDKLTFNSDGVSGDVTSWADNDVTFTSDNELTLSITVKNLATEPGRNVYVALYDIDQPEKLKTTMKVDEKSYLASTVTEIAPEGQVAFEIKLTPKNLNESFTANYEYLLDLDSEKFNAETIASKIKTGVNNSEYGSITYSLDDATKTQLTLTATPKSGYYLLGFVQGDSDSSSFISNNNNYIVDLRYYTARQFNAIFYSSSERINLAESTGGYNYYDVYIGSGYASHYGGLHNSFDDIVDEVVYDNNTYKVYQICDGMLQFTSRLDTWITNKNVSSMYGFGGSNLNIDSDTIVVLSNVNYFDILKSQFSLCNIYINNSPIIQHFTYEAIYYSNAERCPNFYINENIIEYVQYNEWFVENYDKAATPTSYNGATYYLYTYDDTIA